MSAGLKPSRKLIDAIKNDAFKDDQTSKEFYFVGTIKHNGHTQEFVMPDTDNIHAVEIGYHLNTPVEPNLYEYITEKSL